MNRGIVWCPHCGNPHVLGTTICPTTAKSLDRSMNEEQQHPLVGTVLGGKYVIKRLIGAGGMGAVFEAENRLLRRLVAIKIVANASATPEAVLRLEREAFLVSAIQHPNICDVLDVGTLPDGSPFMVLERLFGENIQQRLVRERMLPMESAIDIMTQVLSGLHAAHGAHIVHRDLKPQNIYLVDRIGLPPLVKLVDFGFAKDMSGIRLKRITRPGTLLGTARYMAPEQLKAEPVDARTDVFAVGIVMFEMLTGAHPFAGGEYDDIRSNVLRSKPARLIDVAPHLPSALSAILDRALAREPDRRFPTALDFQKVLGGVAVRRDTIPDTGPSSEPPSSAPEF